MENTLPGNENQELAGESSGSLRPAEPDGQSCVAGRELDALVAERVMGLVRCTAGGHEAGDYCHALPDPSGMGGETKCYSTDMAAAMEIVEKMRERGYGWSILTHRDGWFVRCFELPDEGLDWRHSTAVKQSLPEAACVTALLALEETEVADRKCGVVRNT